MNWFLKSSFSFPYLFDNKTPCRIKQYLNNHFLLIETIDHQIFEININDFKNRTKKHQNIAPIQDKLCNNCGQLNSGHFCSNCEYAIDN